MVFAVSMAVLLLASCFVVWRTQPARVATAFTVYLLLAGPWTLFGRYDLVPSLVVLGAVVAATRHRWTLAYVLLACGVLLKLYPLFLLPVFAIEQRRQAPRDVVRGTAAFAVVVAIGLGASALLDPSGWIGPFRFALSRPVESESVPATLLWLVSGLGSPGTLQHSFNSANVVSSASGLVGVLSLVGLAGGLILVYALVARGRLTLGGACIAALLVVIVTSRVLSPQYLIWLLPLVAFEYGLTPLWLAICVLTFAVYPALYTWTGLSDSMPATSFAPAYLVAVAARNALLLVAVVQTVQAGPEPRLSSVR